MPEHAIFLSGSLVRSQLATHKQSFHSALLGSENVLVDLTAVEIIDSAGVALLIGLRRALQQRGLTLHIRHAAPHVARTLALFPYPAEVPLPPAVLESVWLRLGNATLFIGQIAIHFLAMCADLVWFSGSSVRRRQFRGQVWLSEMMQMGPQAFWVVGLIALLVGATVAIQSAAQLRQFGANILIADLIGVSITRELGPLITAVVVAGRTGSAIAAEIATMVITEEVDALIALGLNPVRFIILPKILALIVVLPILTAYANVMAIFGGLCVGCFFLEVPASSFINRLQSVVLLSDIGTGLFKSALFAGLIGSVGAFCGLRTRGGADAVGISTTKSVVVGLFTIIVADAFCSLFFNGGASAP